MIDKLNKAGADVAGGTPEQFGKTCRDENETWKAVIKRANIRAE